MSNHNFVNVQLDPRSRRRLEQLMRSAPRRFHVAEKRAVNKTARSVRTEVSKAVREELALKAAKVKEVTRYIPARGQSTTARVSIRREPMPLKEYKARETRKGVTAKVRKGEPREKHPHAFIVESIGGHVFTRRVQGGKRAGRLPIDKQFGPTVLGVLTGHPGTLERVQDEANETLPRRMGEEVNFELRRLGRGI